MKNFVSYGIVFVLIAFVVYCEDIFPSLKRPQQQPKNETVAIESIYMHRVGEYSVIIRKEKDELLSTMVVDLAKEWAEANGFTDAHGYFRHTPKVRIFANLPAEDQEHLVFKGTGETVDVDIHLHKNFKLLGAEWLGDGKNPERGLTTPLK